MKQHRQEEDHHDIAAARRAIAESGGRRIPYATVRQELHWTSMPRHTLSIHGAAVPDREFRRSGRSCALLSSDSDQLRPATTRIEEITAWTRNARLLLLVMVAFFGCAVPQSSFSRPDLTQIAVGMTTEAVVAKLGEPHEASRDGNAETFVYNYDHPFDGRAAVVESYYVRLVSGRVESFGRVGGRATGTAKAQPARNPTVLGTTFAVATPRTFVTAFHVIDGAARVEVICGNDVATPARVIRVDPANDLAVMTTDRPAPAYLTLAADGSVRLGQRVFTVGFPVPDLLGREPKYSEGAVSSLSGLGDAANVLQMSVPVQPGNSGGPLTDEAGQVVGVVTSSAAVQAFFKRTGTVPQNVNWAVRSEYLRLLLTGVTPEAVPRQIEAVERVRKSVCLLRASS